MQSLSNNRSNKFSIVYYINRQTGTKFNKRGTLYTI